MLKPPPGQHCVNISYVILLYVIIIIILCLCVCIPDGFVSPPLVIPPAVSKIVLEGNDTFFQIHWKPSSVDYGTVIYCVVYKELWKNVEQLQNVLHRILFIIVN